VFSGNAYFEGKKQFGENKDKIKEFQNEQISGIFYSVKSKLLSQNDDTEKETL
jgi:hypothetical protein